MATGYGVLGYLEPSQAEHLAKARAIDKPLTLRLEPRSEHSLTVQPAKVLDVRLGPTENGETAIQIVFEAEPKLTVSDALRPLHEGVTAFNDPVLKRLTQRSIVFKIFV
jgi:hypothetical protein